MGDLAGRDDLRRHVAHRVHGNGEADADVALLAVLRVDLRGDADHPGGRVDQRPAGVAVIDRGVGLDRVFDRQRVRRGDLALHRGDETARQRAGVAERVADRVDGVADADRVRVAELERRQRARVRLDLQHGRVGRRVAPDNRARQLVAARERDEHPRRTLHHVEVGHDVAGLVDHEARAERLAARRARRRHLHDAGRVALVDLLGGKCAGCRRRLERDAADAAPAAERRDLLDRRVAAELAEQRRGAQREPGADDRYEKELERAQGDVACAAHETRYSRKPCAPCIMRLKMS